MKKNFKFIITLLVAVFALSVVGNSAFAAGTSSFKDGSYKVNYSVVYSGDEEIPGDLDLNDFFTNKASLEITDGVQHIELTHTAPSMILSLTVSGTEVETVSENDETRTVRFVADGDLSAVDMGLVMFYGSTHESKVAFNLEAVPVKEESQENSSNVEENNDVAENAEEDNSVVENDTEDNNVTENAEEDNSVVENDTEDNNVVENDEDDSIIVEDNNDNGAVEGADEEEVKNPQTGDTSNIWLYALLLVAAVIPLAIKFKKRFI